MSNQPDVNAYDSIPSFLGGTPSVLAAMALASLEEYLGRKPTDVEIRVLAEQVTAMACEILRTTGVIGGFRKSDRIRREPKTCTHQDSVRFGYDIHGRSQGGPLFVCRDCGAVAADPRAVDWKLMDGLAGYVHWPVGSTFLLMDYRKLAHVHPVAR